MINGRLPLPVSCIARQPLAVPRSMRSTAAAHLVVGREGA